MHRATIFAGYLILSQLHLAGPNERIAERWIQRVQVVIYLHFGASAKAEIRASAGMTKSSYRESDETFGCGNKILEVRLLHQDARARPFFAMKRSAHVVDGK
jgi:hypothetical protein